MCHFDGRNSVFAMYGGIMFYEYKTPLAQNFISIPKMAKAVGIISFLLQKSINRYNTIYFRKSMP